MRIRIFGLLALALIGAAACDDTLPTSTDGELVPIDPQTFEVRIPLTDFVESTTVYGGFGRVAQLGLERIAHEAEGGFEANTLVRFSAFPDFANVRLADGSFELDTMLTYVGARLVARFDTLTSVLDDTAKVVFARVDEEWDPQSASWEFAVDTLGVRRSWNESGAGGFPVLDTAVWKPESSDSVVIEVDSATVASWADTTDVTRGVRLTVPEAGTDLRLRSLSIRIDARPSVRPDTLVEVITGTLASTFVYSPEPPAPGPAFRAGGAPAWRTVFRLNLPATVDAPPEICAVVSCPVPLEAERINFAGVSLMTSPVAAPFAPTDSLALNVREVFSPERLPRAPLGAPRAGAFGILVEPEAFEAGGIRRVTVPMTNYIRDLVRGETTTGDPVSGVIALLSSLEPQTLGFGEFVAVTQGDSAPYLRIIITLGAQRGLP